MKTLLYILGLLPIILYITISFNYEAPFFVELDQEMSERLFGNQFIAWFHNLGETVFVVIITILLLLLLWLRQQNYRAMLFVLASIAGGTVINQTFKAYYARPRPELIDQLTSYSFPSGHSMLGVIYLFTLAYIFSELTAKKSFKVASWLIATVLFILIGLARIAEGRHFATDVLGGWSLGIFWFTICVLWYENRKSKLHLN